MKVFENENGWRKVNFVDENNVFLGYDLDQCCCEDAGYFIKKERITDKNNNIYDEKSDKINLDKYYFVTDYFQERDEFEMDSGGVAEFKITNGCDSAYIYLFNYHNGYYSHGFEFKFNENLIKEYL